MANCDSCVYNVYDEDDEEYYCEVDMDEDDAARLMQGHCKASDVILKTDNKQKEWRNI